MSDRFARFNQGARKVLTYAQEEAIRLNHSYIGTEHILLGLVREQEGVAARVLTGLGVSFPATRRAIGSIVGRGQGPPVRQIGLSPRAKQVMELAVIEARRLNHDFIGTEHLLLGIVNEGEGIAAGILASMGADLARVRAAVEGEIVPGAPVRRRVPRRLPFDSRVALSAVAASAVTGLVAGRRPRLPLLLLVGLFAGLLYRVLPGGRRTRA